MNYASARFGSTLLTAVIGAVVGVGALTLTAQTERWVSFGGGCVAVAAVALAFLVPRRGAIQRGLDLPAVLIGIWLLVASRAIESSGAGATPHAIKWLSLAGGAALCGVGAVGLLLHEAGLERDLQRLVEHPWMVQAARAHDDASGPGSLTTDDSYDDALSRAAGR